MWRDQPRGPALVRSELSTMTTESLAMLRNSARAWALVLVCAAAVLTLAVVQIVRVSDRPAKPAAPSDIPTQTGPTSFLP